MYEKIVEVLSFLGALRDYSAIDRLGNAIDEISFYEAVRDAIRAYYARCGVNGEECVDIGDGERKIRCPSIAAEDLENDVNQISRTLGSQDKLRIIKLSRELAMKSYAKIHYHLTRICEPSQQGGSQAGPGGE